MTIVDAGSTPAFLEIAARAAHLRELGMSDRAIARDRRQRQDRREEPATVPHHENLGTVDEALGPEDD
ncbi:MAG TPA: hypothetical protein VHX62_07410 [Solirubrobacteraceae bacterium]|nr:hypothetical protein [Solirubrobacteraceae bacterium]